MDKEITDIQIPTEFQSIVSNFGNTMDERVKDVENQVHVACIKAFINIDGNSLNKEERERFTKGDKISTNEYATFGRKLILEFLASNGEDIEVCKHITSLSQYYLDTLKYSPDIMFSLLSDEEMQLFKYLIIQTRIIDSLKGDEYEMSILIRLLNFLSIRLPGNL